MKIPCIDCSGLGGSICRNGPGPAPRAGCSCSCHQVTTYESLGAAIGRVVIEKQAAYGDSFGRSGAVMPTLYPEGIKLEQLDDALTLVRIIDKLFRVATNRDALGEDPFRDIAGYALLAAKRVEDQRLAARSSS